MKLYATMNGWGPDRKDAGERIKFPGMPPIDKYVKDALAAELDMRVRCRAETCSRRWIAEWTVIPGVTLENSHRLFDCGPARGKGGRSGPVRLGASDILWKQ